MSTFTKTPAVLVAALGLGGLLLGGTGLTLTTPVTAHADTTATQGILHSGEYGTSHWYITDDLTLHIGAGTLANTTGNGPAWQAYGNQVTKIVIDGPVVLPANSRGLFGYLGATEIDGLDKIDASHATSLTFAFYGTQVTNLDLSSWDVHNVTDASFLFGQAQSPVINLTGWKMPKLTNAYWMFMMAAHVHELDLSGINFRKANLSQAFMYSNLTVLHLGPDSLLKGSNFNPFTNDAYHDAWQEIGTGTVAAPNGKVTYQNGAALRDNYDGSAPGTYVRAKNPGGTITARYLDQLDQPLTPDVTVDGYFGDDFTTTQKAFPGYTFQSVTGDPTGQFDADPHTVTYHYTQDEKNQQSLTGENATITVGDATPTAATFHAQATDKHGQTIPVAVDLSGAQLDTPGTYDVRLTTSDDQSLTVKLTVKAAESSSSSSSTSSSSSSSSTSSSSSSSSSAIISSSSSAAGSTSSSAPTSSISSSSQPSQVKPPLNDGDLITGGESDLSAFKGEAIYATKALNLYRHPTFKQSQRKAHYAKQPRVKRPMFVVTGAATTKAGTLRFKVRDVNHDRKTDGQVGYITAKKAYVSGVYYQHVYRKVSIINPHGVNSYRTRKLTGKTHHYRKGQVLTVKRIVRYHLTTRYVLINGRYVTANKKLIKAHVPAARSTTQHSVALHTRTTR